MVNKNYDGVTSDWLIEKRNRYDWKNSNFLNKAVFLTVYNILK